MASVETVKVKIKDGGHDAIINKSDYDPKLHKLASGEDAEEGSDGLTDEERTEFRRLEAKRKFESNRGTGGGPEAAENGKNPSGTYSEPTPTDIRFPNLNDTEFENNHGAFLNRSAADIRAAEGLEDRPGGLNPAVKEKVDAATSAIAEVAGASDTTLPPPRAAEAQAKGEKGEKPVDEMTVAELKDKANDHQIDVSGAGNKAELLERVKAGKTE